MKAISLWQPWATLIATGAKIYETRSWDTRYRGPIAIHASKKMVMEHGFDFWKSMAEAIGTKYDFDAGAGMPMYTTDILKTGKALYNEQFPLGAVLATAELVGCWTTHCLDNGGFGIRKRVQYDSGKASMETIEIFEPELLFGDFSPGRYAWELVNVKMLKEPIPAKGRQGLWECEVI